MVVYIMAVYLAPAQSVAPPVADMNGIYKSWY